MDTYYLYLDESETHDSGKNRVFCIAGIIVKKEDDENLLIPAVSNLKSIIWHDLNNYNDIILHQKDVSFANNRSNNLKNVLPEYHRFKQNKNTKILYNELSNIYAQNYLTVIGTCIKLDDLNTYFHKDIISDKYLIGMQILFENFCHFLKQKNAIGYVYYESREYAQDKEVARHFNHIKAMGSMFINPYGNAKTLKRNIFSYQTR